MGRERPLLYHPLFLSAQTQVHDFKYHLYADDSQMCTSSAVLSFKLQTHIFYCFLISFMKVSAGHLKLSMSKLMMSPSPNLLTPSLLSTSGSAHPSFLLVSHITRPILHQIILAPPSNLYPKSNHFPPPLLPPFCSSSQFVTYIGLLSENLASILCPYNLFSKQPRNPKPAHASLLPGAL